MKRLFAALTAAALLTSAPSTARAGLVIGGFDAARADQFALTTGVHSANLRAALTADFAGVTFVASTTLTSDFLSGIDVLLVFNSRTTSTPITALTAAEQAAVRGFVEAGGGAVIVHGRFPVSQSLLDPFGVTQGGNTSGNVTVTNATHPVTNGPFGNVTNYPAGFGSSYSNLGPDAASLATARGNAQTRDVLAVIAPGQLAAGSGGVVLIATPQIWGFVDGSGTIPPPAVSRPLMSNSVAFVAPAVAAVPAPSAVMLAVAGAGGLGLLRRRLGLGLGRG